MDDVPASFSSSTAKKLPAKGSTSSSMDRKFKFSERLFRLNGNELGHVIQTIEQKCPHVLEDVASSGTSPQVEINVDQLPTAVFTELEAYVQSKIPNRKKRKLNWVVEGNEYVVISKSIYVVAGYSLGQVCL